MNYYFCNMSYYISLFKYVLASPGAIWCHLAPHGATNVNLLLCPYYPLSLELFQRVKVFYLNNAFVKRFNINCYFSNIIFIPKSTLRIYSYSWWIFIFNNNCLVSLRRVESVIILLCFLFLFPLGKGYINY